MKRGASELIATVLIIGFVIVLAGVLFAWQTGFFEDVKGKYEKRISLEESCLQSDLEIISACNDESFVYLTLQNRGTIALVGCQVIVFNNNGESEVIPCFPYPLIDAYSTQKLILPYTIANPRESAEVIPQIRIEGNKEYCINNKESIVIGAC